MGYASLIAGFFGAVIGAAGSICVVWLQQRSLTRQHRASLVVRTAIEAYRSAEHYAEFMATQGRPTVSPELAYYVVLHTRLIEVLSTGNVVSGEQWLKAYRDAEEIQTAVRKLQDLKGGGAS